MASFLSNIGQGLPSKTGEQCKSFDERQKKEIYTDVDLLEAAFTELKQAEPDAFSIALLSEYVDKMDHRSDYMSFLANQDLPIPAQPQLPSQPTLKEEEVQFRPQSVGDLIFNEFFD